MSKAIEAQLEVKAKCDQAQEALRGLYEWEHEMKQKEYQSTHSNQEKLRPPVRSLVAEMTKYSEEQHSIEKQRSITNSEMLEYLEEAEKYNKIGNELCKRAKPGEYKENNDQTAIEMYTSSIELNDRNPTPYVKRALCYFNLGRYEECITDCESAIALDKTNVEAYYRRMQAYEYLGKNRLAVLDCQEILKISKDAKELSKVKNDMERIKKRIRHEADKFKQQGNDHLSKKNYEKAIECFSAAIELYGSDEVYHHNRGLCYFNLKHYDKSLEDFNKAIETNKEYFRPYYQRMRLREIRGEYLSAIDDCKRFLELVPDDRQRVTAGKDLERLQFRLECKTEPVSYNWNQLNKSSSIINFIQKPPHQRSKKPLKRIFISEENTPDSKSNPSNYIVASDYDTIPDAVIDKMFNNNTGERLEEPIEDTNLCSFFSSSSNKLKKYFSPPITPSSPPSDMLRGHLATSNVIPLGYSSSSASVTEAEKDSTGMKPETFEETLHPTKEEKDMINQENCQPETEINSYKVKTIIKYGEDNSIPVLPSSSVHFYNTWNNLKTTNEKYKYLKSLQDVPLDKLLGAELSPEMLTEVLYVLERFCTEENYSPLRILAKVTKHRGIDLLVMMLTDKDRCCLRQLVHLMDTLEEDSSALREVKKILNCWGFSV
ncbi:RNA polymerase II-associated protein 3 isoform X2 [Topomyia yanbarensis]|uniref:RNA polymerase II-associated protein 3 isoform X2 n=1 Tax=Topomyia yanbarensis TaxID=2498891 RepID=UPI00273B45C7|nr:RNA polymerase II-associated protein 3 isoform X2 [Topomyia yanbarensis]